MRKIRFAEPQIMAVLRQAENGAAVPELCREHGISVIVSWLPPFGSHFDRFFGPW